MVLVYIWGQWNSSLCWINAFWHRRQYLPTVPLLHLSLRLHYDDKQKACKWGYNGVAAGAKTEKWGLFMIYPQNRTISYRIYKMYHSGRQTNVCRPLHVYFLFLQSQVETAILNLRYSLVLFDIMSQSTTTLH